MITDKLQTTESGHQQLWTMVATPRLALLQQNVGATIQFRLHAATLTIKKVVQCCASSLTSLHPKGPQLDVNTENQVNSDLQQQTSAGEEPKPRLLFVEVFAGSAKLSSTAYERGFRTLAIDHGGNQHEPHHEIAIYDLTSHAAQSQLLGALEDDIPSAMHMAPPCGTCSRAREKPLPELGKHAPRPLRDEHYPFGYPWLKGVDKTRIFAEQLALCFRGGFAFFRIHLQHCRVGWKPTEFMALGHIEGACRCQGKRKLQAMVSET